MSDSAYDNALQLVLYEHRRFIENPDEGKRLDLREADLREADLRGADLRGADLRWTDLREVCLYGASISRAMVAARSVLQEDQS